LSCTGNSPAPTDAGRPNSVSGPKSGQCATL
jgi:hexosaminidase